MPPVGVSIRYRASMRALIKQMTDETEKEIIKLFKSSDVKEFFAQDDTPSSQARIITNYLMKKFTKLFSQKAKPLAERFVIQSDRASEAAVNISLKEMAKSFTIPREALSYHLDENLSAIVTENVSLIKSISQQYLSQVQQSVMRSITNGTGLTELRKDMRKHKAISERRANIIALDQTRKASESLGRERFKKRGIQEYEWRHTSGGLEPRHLHVEYDGRVFRYDTPMLVQKATKTQPAIYGFPSTLINCRCRAVPVIKIKS